MNGEERAREGRAARESLKWSRREGRKQVACSDNDAVLGTEEKSEFFEV